MLDNPLTRATAVNNKINFAGIKGTGSVGGALAPYKPFRAQEILNQLPRQLTSGPRMSQLMPGPKIPPTMSPASDFVERINNKLLLNKPMPGELPSADISEYLLHGGPREDQLFGGVINPEFIRGGKLFNIIKEADSMNLLGRNYQQMNAPSVLTQGTQVSQGQGVLASYASVVDVIKNANKYSPYDYVPNHLKMNQLGNPLFPDNAVKRKSDHLGHSIYLWKDQVSYARNWLAKNKKIVEAVMSGASHSTGVKPTFMSGNAAYEVGNIHLLKIPRSQNPSAEMGGLQSLSQDGAMAFRESPFWGSHKPIASAEAGTNNAVKRKESYMFLIHKMIEDANQSLPTKIMEEFALSQKIYNNQITPGARAFIIDEFGRNSFEFEKESSILAQELFKKATNKEEMLNIVQNITKRKYPKYYSTAKDLDYDQSYNRIIETINEFAYPRVIPTDELASIARFNSIINSGVDAASLGVADKVGTITYGEALRSFKDMEILKQIPERHHQLFRDALSGVPINAESQAYRGYASVLPKINDVIKESEMINGSIYGEKNSGIFSLLPLLAAGTGGTVASLFAGNKAAYAQAIPSANSEAAKYQEYMKQIRVLSEFIATGESSLVKDPYSAWYGGKDMMMSGMTSMTINDVIAKSNQRAVGKYQNMPKYLLQRALLANLKGSDLYDAQAQEAIQVATLMEKSPVSLGLKDFMSGKMNTRMAVDKIANTWRSMPKLGGEYVGGGANPEGFDSKRKDLVIKNLLEQMKNYYPEYKKGGYVGYANGGAVPAVLHGGEYVLNAKSVAKIGMPQLQAMNAMKFATPNVSYNTPNPQISSYPTGQVSSSTSNVNIYVDNFIGEPEWFKSMMSQYNTKILPGKQKSAGLENRVISTYTGLNGGK